MSEINQQPQTPETTSPLETSDLTQPPPLSPDQFPLKNPHEELVRIAGQSEAAQPEAKPEEATKQPEAEAAQPEAKPEEATKQPEAEEIEEETTSPKDKLNQAGDKLVEALVKGEGLQEAVEEFTKAQMEKEGLLSLTSEALMRQAANEVVQFLKANPSEARRRLNPAEREQLRFQKEIQERIKKIVQLEVQVASLPIRMEALKKMAKEVKDELIRLLPSLKKPIDDEEARKERMKFYGLLIQLANLKAEAIKVRHGADILSIQINDLRREVMAKTGMFKGIGGLLARFADWASNRGREIVLDARMSFEGEFDFDYDKFSSTSEVGLKSL